MFCGTAREGFLARVRFRWAGSGGAGGQWKGKGGEEKGERKEEGAEGEGEGEVEGGGRWFEVEHWVEVRVPVWVCGLWWV